MKMAKIYILEMKGPVLDRAISELIGSKVVVPYRNLKNETQELLDKEGIVVRRMRPWHAWSATKSRGDGSGMNHVAEGPTSSIAGLRLMLLLRYPDGVIDAAIDAAANGAATMMEDAPTTEVPQG